MNRIEVVWQYYNTVFKLQTQLWWGQGILLVCEFLNFIYLDLFLLLLLERNFYYSNGLCIIDWKRIFLCAAAFP